RPVQVWLQLRGVTVEHPPIERPWPRAEIGALVTPVVSLATLAVLARRELPLEHRVAGGVTVADVLCGRATAAPPITEVLAQLSGTDVHEAVRALITTRLRVTGEVDLRRPGRALASARALGRVLAAWGTLTRGRIVRRLPVPPPALVRRAWAAASHLIARPEHRGGPRWQGPGVARNVGGRLSAQLSPLAFGEVDHDAGALAVCEPDLDLTLAVLAPLDPAIAGDRVSAGTLRAQVDELVSRVVAVAGSR
ncbi:MAG TPA: hypothetical protein VF183_02730, partial [Acidimicrobiales bacterium]